MEDKIEKATSKKIDSLQQLLVPDNMEEDIPIDELTLFVDPLDGTREFVEGRLENVACLIGVSRNGKSLAGTVGLPFPNGALDSEPLVHYSLLSEETDAFIGTSLDASSPSSENERDSKEASSTPSTITVFTGDSNDPVLRNATQAAISIASTTLSDMPSSEDSTPKSPTHSIIGGTASKFLAVANTPNSIAITHFKTQLWDTCATEALVHGKGGKVTDLFGSPLPHSANYKPGSNVFGVVASSGEDHMNVLHDTLCKEMRKDAESLKRIFGKWVGDYNGVEGQMAQAIDVARDLEGAPLDRLWLQDQLQPEKTDSTSKSFSLKGFAIPETTTARGLMSNGCRLLMEWEPNSTTSASQTLPPPFSAFYKRVVMSESPDSRFKLKNVPHKLIRDVKSYQVETAFLTSDACQRGLIQEAGVHVNKVYASDLRPAPKGTGPKEQIQSKFAMLVQDLSKENGWKQEWLLEKESSKAALEAFARMHGYFWHGSDFWNKEEGKWGQELEDAVWSNGGYMQPALQGLDQLEQVAAGWTARLPSFEDALKEVTELQNVDLNEIGMRLQNVAKSVGQKSHPFADGASASDYQKYRTFIHGDPKQANIFLRTKKSDEGSQSDVLEAGLIDFQWSGFGLAATDVAHHICASVQPHCLSYDGNKEEELLDFYYDCLSKSLIQNGVASSEEDVQQNIYPRSVLQEQYEVAVLDICRMVFAYAWKRWKPEDKPTPASLNRNSYNKSLPNVLWLITRCSQILTAREKDLNK